MNRNKARKVDDYTYDLSDVGLTKCVKCGSSQQTCLCYNGLYYVQCTCDKWNPYIFLGLTLEKSIAQWKEGNRPISSRNKGE